MSSKSSVRSLPSIQLPLHSNFPHLHLFQCSSPLLSSLPFPRNNILPPISLLQYHSPLRIFASWCKSDFKGRWTSNKDAADHHWKPCRMFIDGNSSNYLKIIDKWQPVVCADVLGEPEMGWDCRLELSTALHARQTIKPFKQFLKGVAIRSLFSSLRLSCFPFPAVFYSPFFCSFV